MAIRRSRPAQMACIHSTICHVLMRSSILIFVSIAFPIEQIVAQDFEREPINYLTTRASNRVSLLQEKLDDKTENLEFDGARGYLTSVLRALNIPVSSQTLVFSKTSLQRHRITPETPRAIYFNDETYVGFCQNGDVLEVSTVDSALGAVFYTLNQDAAEAPKFVRQSDNCLICHGSSNTRGVPGHLVRSVYVDKSGFPVLSMGTHRIDHSSAIEKRWGGWYVTGSHGNQTHLGNMAIASESRREPIENSAGQNLTTIESRIATSKYLSPHSDLIALMVLEHQVEAHNLLTRASFQTREAIYAAARLNKDLGNPEDHHWESTTTRIKNACDSLVKYLLFSEEAAITSRFNGTSAFADDFSGLGPRDPKGRSLRDFDLERRLFRYPCSYLIYSRAFDELPKEAKTMVYQRLWDVLRGTDRTREFSHFSDEDRTAILEILLATKPGLPEYWYQTRAMEDQIR